MCSQIIVWQLYLIIYVRGSRNRLIIHTEDIYDADVEYKVEKSDNLKQDFIIGGRVFIVLTQFSNVRRSFGSA